MPKVKVEHSTSMTSADCVAKIKNIFENDHDLKKIDSNIKCVISETTMKGQVQGSQFKAELEIHTIATGSQVLVVVDLPFLLSPFKGKVEEMLKRKLSKHLGS